VIWAPPIYLSEGVWDPGMGLPEKGFGDWEKKVSPRGLTFFLPFGLRQTFQGKKEA